MVEEKDQNKSSTINGQELIEDRIKFKLHAAEHHLKNLQALEQDYVSISTFEGRIKWEIEIEDFLFQLVGIRDAVLFRINDKIGLKLKNKKVTLDNVETELNAHNKKSLWETIKIFKEHSNWFSALNKLRNQSTHRKLVNIHVAVGTGKRKVYLITDPQTELEPIPYLEDSLQNMKCAIILRGTGWMNIQKYSGSRREGLS